MQAGRCILIRYLQPRDVYMLKYARDVKRMKLAGYRVARLLFYAGNGFLASRPSPPCAPRPGYRALFIRYERCLHGIFKTWRCSKIRAITDNFFSFIYTYICMYERCTKYICIYVCTKRNVLRWIIGLSRSGTRMENFTAADQKKEGTSWKGRIENRARWRRISSNPPCTNYYQLNQLSQIT